MSDYEIERRNEEALESYDRAAEQGPPDDDREPPNDEAQDPEPEEGEEQ